MIDIVKQPEVAKIDKTSLLGDEPVVQEQVEEQKDLSKFSDFEKKMMDHGWNPEGELSAEDWIDNGFKVKNKKLDNLYQSVETLKDKLARQEKEAYAKARADLEAQRIAAIEEADVERVREIEKKTQSLIAPSDMEVINAFTKKHSAWLEGQSFRDKEMALVCKNKDVELSSEVMPLETHFQKLEEYMHQKYPDYFKSEEVPVVSAVEGKQPAAAKANSKKKMTFDDLDEFQKKAARNLLKTKGITIEDYIKRLTELEKSR